MTIVNFLEKKESVIEDLKEYLAENRNSIDKNYSKLEICLTKVKNIKAPITTEKSIKIESSLQIALGKLERIERTINSIISKMEFDKTTKGMQVFTVENI
jgi:uncharacterized coiled-coil protein SlyX